MLLIGHREWIVQQSIQRIRMRQNATVLNADAVERMPAIYSDRAIGDDNIRAVIIAVVEPDERVASERHCPGLNYRQDQRQRVNDQSVMTPNLCLCFHKITNRAVGMPWQKSRSTGQLQIANYSITNDKMPLVRSFSVCQNS